MTWPEQVLESWEQFSTTVLSAHVTRSAPLSPALLYRGQANAKWTLEPALLRLCSGLDVDRPGAIQLEQRLVGRFKTRAHLFLDAKVLPTGFGTLLTPQSSSLEWWTLIQHYGGPSRLLDWTLSPLVGLYFAVRSKWDVPGAVWYIDARALTAESDQRFGPEPTDDDALWRSSDPAARVLARTSSRPTDRMIAQQGAFTVCQDPMADQAPAIANALGDSASTDQYCKYLIPPNAKRPILRQLHTMNVTAGALFPGIDGLGAELQELARL